MLVVEAVEVVVVVLEKEGQVGLEENQVQKASNHHNEFHRNYIRDGCIHRRRHQKEMGLG